MQEQASAEILYLKTADRGASKRSREMSDLSHNIGLVLHVDESLEDARRQDIEQAIGSQQGINSARFTDRRPHLMVVEYDPSQLSSFDVLCNVHRQQVHAELIGPV